MTTDKNIPNKVRIRVEKNSNNDAINKGLEKSKIDSHPILGNSSINHFSEKPILEAVGLSKIYKVGKQLVSPVKDISLQIGYGDFVIIFGPSGAGKSTLVNILMGIESPDVGEVFLKDESLYKYGSEERAKIRLKRFGIVTQIPYFLDQLSILDNVALPLLLDGESKKNATVKARKLLKSVKMGKFEKFKPRELSGGQQQKVAIARAIVNDPWLIFADEPTLNLDAESVDEVINILLDANKNSGRTIIMVTHNLEFLKYSKKWFFVKDGRLWDAEDSKNPFHNIKEVVGYVKEGLE